MLEPNMLTFRPPSMKTSKNNKILLTFILTAGDFNLSIYAVYDACYNFTADRECK
jgi:hypothetical protein